MIIIIMIIIIIIIIIMVMIIMLIMMIIIVFVAALDLTKAYDRFNQCILILKLYDIGMPKGYC